MGKDTYLTNERFSATQDSMISNLAMNLSSNRPLEMYKKATLTCKCCPDIFLVHSSRLVAQAS